MQTERIINQSLIDTHDEDVIRINCKLEETRSNRKTEDVADTLQFSFEYYNSEGGGGQRGRKKQKKKEETTSSTSESSLNWSKSKRVQGKLNLISNKDDFTLLDL
jgi:hypothetical protein